MIHLMGWSKPMISNAVRDCSRHMQMSNKSHIQAMHRIMQYFKDTKDQGLKLQPNGVWDGSRDYKFIISGRSDLDYATDPETRESVTGTRVSVNGTPVSWRSTIQKSISLCLSLRAKAVLASHVHKTCCM